jgi:histidyl-tRNA synthetase
VGKELLTAGISPAAATGMLETLIENFKSQDFATARQRLQETGASSKGVDEIEQVYHHALNLGVPRDYLLCDPLLARGLDYYTGPIFETVLPQHPHIGSLSGGGRYDGLVGTFSKENVPATGTTLGLDRIQTALEQLGKFTAVPSLTQVLITRFDPAGIDDNLKIASILRRTGINVEVWYDDDRMKKQFAYADKQGIPLVVICGPDERMRGTVAVKNMKRAEQKEIPREQLAETVRQLLHAL